MEALNNTLDLEQFDIDYERRTDTFYFRLLAVVDWVAEDVNGEFFLLRDVETKRPVGFLVEDFERVFLKNHPELEHAWIRTRWHVSRRGHFVPATRSPSISQGSVAPRAR